MDPHRQSFLTACTDMLTQTADMQPIDARENSGAVEVLVAHPYHVSPVWRGVRGVERPDSQFPECIVPRELPRWTFLQDSATGYVYAIVDGGEPRRVDVDWNPRRANRGLSVAGSRGGSRRRH